MTTVAEALDTETRDEVIHRLDQIAGTCNSLARLYEEMAETLARPSVLDQRLPFDVHDFRAAQTDRDTKVRAYAASLRAEVAEETR